MGSISSTYSRHTCEETSDSLFIRCAFALSVCQMDECRPRIDRQGFQEIDLPFDAIDRWDDIKTVAVSHVIRISLDKVSDVWKI